MKKFLLLIVVFMSLAVMTNVTQAQVRPVNASQAQVRPNDISRLKPVVHEYMAILRGIGNIPFGTSYQSGTMYKADWPMLTAGMPVSVFVDNVHGVARIRLVLHDPPAVLANQRAPHNSLTAWDVDGNIPAEDKAYWGWYYRWQTRPHPDLEDMLRFRKLYRRLWIATVEKYGTVESFGKEWEAMGFADNGLPYYVDEAPIYDYSDLTGENGEVLFIGQDLQAQTYTYQLNGENLEIEYAPFEGWMPDFKMEGFDVSEQNETKWYNPTPEIVSSPEESNETDVDFLVGAGSFAIIAVFVIVLIAWFMRTPEKMF